MIALAQKGLCPICGKPKKKHTSKQLHLHRKVFAERFPKKGILHKDNQDVEIDVWNDVSIRGRKK